MVQALHHGHLGLRRLQRLAALRQDLRRRRCEDGAGPHENHANAVVQFISVQLPRAGQPRQLWPPPRLRAGALVQLTGAMGWAAVTTLAALQSGAWTSARTLKVPQQVRHSACELSGEKVEGRCSRDRLQARLLTGELLLCGVVTDQQDERVAALAELRQRAKPQAVRIRRGAKGT